MAGDIKGDEVGNLGKIEIVVLRCYPTSSEDETPSETPAETLAETPVEIPAETAMETHAETPTETPAEVTAETPAEMPAKTPTESMTGFETSKEQRVVRFEESDNLSDSQPYTPVSSLFDEGTADITAPNEALNLPTTSGKDQNNQIMCSSGAEQVNLGQMSTAVHEDIGATASETVVQMVVNPVQVESHWLNGFQSHRNGIHWPEESFISTTPCFTSARPVITENILNQPRPNLGDEEILPLPCQENSKVGHISPV